MSKLTTASRAPAQVFVPGEFIREELEVRGWAQRDFARILGRPLQNVNSIINGKTAITAATAKQLALVLGTSAELWLNLETAYRLATAEEPDPRIASRAQRFAHA
jgi:HTH-type transcriptional regulator/antitoxin HigA